MSGLRWVNRHLHSLPVARGKPVPSVPPGKESHSSCGGIVHIRGAKRCSPASEGSVGEDFSPDRRGTSRPRLRYEDLFPENRPAHPCEATGTPPEHAAPRRPEPASTRYASRTRAPRPAPKSSLCTVVSALRERLRGRFFRGIRTISSKEGIRDEPLIHSKTTASWRIPRVHRLVLLHHTTGNREVRRDMCLPERRGIGRRHVSAGSGEEDGMRRGNAVQILFGWKTSLREQILVPAPPEKPRPRRDRVHPEMVLPATDQLLHGTAAVFRSTCSREKP